MIQELTSEQFFNEVVDFAKPHTPLLTKTGKKAYGNCPFCQRDKPDSHHQYFGVWCHYRRVYLGCHNPLCNLGTSNNILDFIQRIESVDFPAALAMWQEFVGIEPVSEERYLSDLDELHKACRDAFSGNGKYKQNYIIRKSKRTLIEDFEWHWEELFSEVFKRKVVLYFNKASVNQKYLVQMMANHLQKLVKQEIERAGIEISEQRLLGAYIGEDIRNGILDFVNSQKCSTDSLIEREMLEMYQLALNMAYERLNKIELRIIIDEKFSIRRASQITGIPKSTIANRLNKKLMKIREECLKAYSM